MKQIHLSEQGKKRTRNVPKKLIGILTLLTAGISIGVWFSTRDLYTISPDFHSPDSSKRVTLQHDLEKVAANSSSRTDHSRLKGSGGKTGGGGDPRARVTKKGVLGIVGGSVRGSSIASTSVASGSGTAVASNQKGSAGIGFGSGRGSGYGGSAQGVDDLLGSLMGGGGSLNQKKSLKVKGPSGAAAAGLSSNISGRQVLPTVSSNEEYKSESVPGIVRTINEPLSTFSIDVDAASYSNVRRMLNQGTLPPRGAVRVEEMVNYFTYDYPQPKGKHPFSITTELSECPWNRDHYLAHIGIQGKKIESTARKASNLVFLIDVSGSMGSPEKLPLVVRSLKMLTSQMDKRDKISIAVYAGAAGAVLEPTSGANKQAIKNALNRLQSGGSTAGGAGIKLAYDMAHESFIKGGNNRVIIATDGDFNVGVSSASELTKLIESRRDKGIFLSVLGFGRGNYKDHRMEQLADKGNGNYAYIDNILEAKKVLVTEMQSTLFTIAKDVKIQIEFNPATVEGYKLIGYENRRLAKEDFNDDKKDAGELGAGHTVTAIYEIVPAGKKIAPAVDPLKYQSNPPKREISKEEFGNELFTVKFRYKKPEGTKSILITKVVENEITPFKNSSDNFRWSTAVTGFGSLLHNPETFEGITMEEVISMARSAKGKDQFGYRSEFIRLAEQAEILLNERYGG